METKKITRRLMTLLWVIISLAVLAGLVWGLYTVLANLVAHLMTLNPNVAASIIATFATVLSGVGGGAERRRSNGCTSTWGFCCPQS